MKCIYLNLIEVKPGSGGGIKWEIGIDIHTLLPTKYITNKDLLYSTGNSTQSSVMIYMERNLKKVAICIHITFTLLYSRNKHNIVNQLHFNKNKNDK